jgi:hypothetical protein
MPKGKIVSEVKHGVVPFARDVGGIGSVLVATGLGREVGAVAGYIIGPRIAETEAGKLGSKIVAILGFADSLLMRLTGTNYGTVV